MSKWAKWCPRELKQSGDVALGEVEINELLEGEGRVRTDQTDQTGSLKR